MPDTPYLLCLGRVDGHKGTTLLAAYFARYKERRPGPLRLVLAGPVVEAPQPTRMWTWSARSPRTSSGTCSAGQRHWCRPSPWEAFSLVVAEAWSARTPVLVNAGCAATVEHCRRSGGGLRFDGYGEFEVAVDRLVADTGFGTGLGRRGRAYVDARFRWPLVIDRYASFLTSVVARGERTARPRPDVWPDRGPRRAERMGPTSGTAQPTMPEPSGRGPATTVTCTPRIDDPGAMRNTR